MQSNNKSSTNGSREDVAVSVPVATAVSSEFSESVAVAAQKANLSIVKDDTQQPIPAKPSNEPNVLQESNNPEKTATSKSQAQATSSFTSMWLPWWKWLSYGNGTDSSTKAFLEISGFLFPSTGLKLPPAFIQGDSTVRLLVYPSDYGCPSFDPVCLQSLTYMRFLGQRYVVEYYAEPLVSPSGDLPCLLNDYGYCVGGRESVVKAFEQKAGKLLDAKLNDEQKSLVQIYSVVVEKDIRLAMLYCCWLDQENFNNVTRDLYGKHYPQILKGILMWQRQNQVKSIIKSQYRGNLVEKTFLLEQADRALAQLADLLAKRDQRFLLGNRPSSLDAIVHGLLFLIMQLPFPNNDLKTILMKYKSLVSYTLNNHRDFFPEF